MDDATNNLTKNVSILNELGLHARPAALIAAIAREAKSKIWMIRNGERVDASSIIDILTLACPKGTEVILQVENSEDMGILDRIAVLFQEEFGE